MTSPAPKVEPIKKTKIDHTTEITNLVLHEAVSIPGFISGLRSINQTTCPGVKASFCDHGILLEIKGKKAVIGIGNLNAALLAD